VNTLVPELLLPEIIRISTKAGEAILRVYRQEFDVEHKDDASPLTAADLASHNLIRDALLELTPDTPLLSEESALVDFALRSGWQEYWLIDPLDGTREFIKRNGEFTVNIALVRNHQPVMGVVHVPVSKFTYCGIAGGRARRLDAHGNAIDIAVRQPSADPVVVVGSRSHANPVLEHGKFTQVLPGGGR
jgi:3'(2'), 5'-bisphosphate nucleotidase